MTSETKNKVCVISLTFNRPDYIKRSFDSLYNRAGCGFDHYVFDDASDEETTAMLHSLQEQYGFTLLQNSETLGIFKNFHKNVREIPLTYEYYVKLDSDIEVLSDNLFSEMIEVFPFHSAVCGATPKVEGVQGSQRSEEKMGTIQFFDGHAVRLNAPVVAGCCLMFTQKVFSAFPRMTDEQLADCKDKWAIDAMLYNHALNFGRFVVIEDLSVYHIDNTYGQRKHDMLYFTARNRWNTMDKDEVWFMRVSRDIFPNFLDRSVLSLLKRSTLTPTYESFYKACESALKYGFTEETVKLKESIDVLKTAVELANEPVITLFKVSAPPNFVPSKNLKKGEVRYYRQLPAWARKDSGIVVEAEKMTEVDAEMKAYKEPQILTRERSNGIF